MDNDKHIKNKLTKEQLLANLKRLSLNSQKAILMAVKERKEMRLQEQGYKTSQDAQNNQIAVDTPKQE